jgi:hypothetical protein
MWSMMERLGAGPPWNLSASAMQGASLCQEWRKPVRPSLRVGSNNSFLFQERALVSGQGGRPPNNS